MKHRTLPRYRHSGQLTIAAAGRLFLAAIAMVWDGRDIERIFKLGGVHPTTPDLEHRAILVLKSMQRRRHKAPNDDSPNECFDRIHAQAPGALIPPGSTCCLVDAWGHRLALVCQKVAHVDRHRCDYMHGGHRFKIF